MSVTDDRGNLLWKTTDMDAQGRLLEAELGNGAVTRHTYDMVMHRLQSIVTTKNLQNLTYNYDKFGNLAARKDWKRNMEETFSYDDMNRLTGITLKRPSGQDLHCAVTYDALGRMTSKQAVTEPDNLGSWMTITDANGIEEQQMSFDAWGNRRDPQTWANYTNNDAFEEPM